MADNLDRLLDDVAPQQQSENAFLDTVEDTVVHGLLLSDTVKNTVGHGLNRMKTRFPHGHVNISTRY